MKQQGCETLRPRKVNCIHLITAAHHQHLINLSLFESLDGDPGFVGADCPCMRAMYADCENFGASAPAPLEKALGM